MTLTESLFRQEVVEARRTEWLGSIRLRAPRIGWALLGFGTCILAAFLLLLVAGHYTRYERVEGTLVPSGGLITSLPASAGVVIRVLVHEGDKVRAGQPLVELSSEQNSTSLGATHAVIASQLQIRLERLESDIEEQESSADLQKRSLRSQLDLIRAQRDQLEQQIALQQQRADSATAIYQSWKSLGSTGIVSKLQILQQHDAALAYLVDVKKLRAQRFQLLQQDAQLQGELTRLPASIMAKRNDTERQIAELTQSMAENAAQRSNVVCAQVDGIVTNVLVHPGQATIAQQTMITLLPDGSHLQAELWVPSRAVGFIHVGELVVMRYQAYPYQKFGQHIGQVLEVSRSAVSAVDVGRVLGKNVDDSRYRVEVSLDSQRVLAYGQSEALKSGMSLEADVLLDRRRLIEWIWDPLASFAEEIKSPKEGHRNG
jgi:membrane fusion protein